MAAKLAMAKWGEGDPRWIVEERADATNVNNWHWTEKNATGWSKDRIKELLSGLRVEDSAVGYATIKEVAKLEGEASANNRKAKLIFFFEWNIKCDWEGNLNDEDKTKVEGSLEIPNLSDENDADELTVNVSVKTEHANAFKLKELWRTKGTALIQKKLGDYISALRQEFSQGMILPANKDAAPTEKRAIVQPVPEVIKDFKRTTIQAQNGSQAIAVKIHTKKITMREEFKCTADELYRVFTVKEMVSAFTRAPAQMDAAEKGSRFSLFGGVVIGEFVELVPNLKIVQRWRHKSWPDEHYSTVTMSLEQGDSCTWLSLVQSGVPESDTERTRDGWKNYYWDSIKQTFGYGARLL